MTAGINDYDLDFISAVTSTGMVGVFFTMILLRLKIMPTYVFDEAKAEWDRERQLLLATLDLVRSERKALVDEVLIELKQLVLEDKKGK